MKWEHDGLLFIHYPIFSYSVLHCAPEGVALLSRDYFIALDADCRGAGVDVCCELSLLCGGAV